MSFQVEDADFDWCSFFALFWNDKGVKPKWHVADTVIFRHGQLCAWWFTNKEGTIQRQLRQKTTLSFVQKRFLEHQEKNRSKFSAIFRRGTDRPVVLNVDEFRNLLKETEESKDSNGLFPCFEDHQNVVLQTYTEPLMDLRYVTTYVNTGHEMTCHTLQRNFSQRYMTTSIREKEVLEEMAGAPTRKTPVDPVVKMQLRAIVHQIVKYIQKAHGFTLSSIMCEFVRSSKGKISLLAVLRTEWASNALGNGSGSFYADSLVKQPEELETNDSYMGTDGEECSVKLDEVESPPSSLALPRQMVASPTSSLQYPGGRQSPANAAASFNLVNSWPSVQHQQLKPWRASCHSARPTRKNTSPAPKTRWRPASAPRETSLSQQLGADNHLASRQANRKPPMIVSHLVQEIEALKDELLLQYELAEASAAKVRNLEKEKNISFLSFSHCLDDLETRLVKTSADLAQTLQEKEALEKVTKGLETKNQELESQQRTLKKTIDEERQTALTSLKEYQRRDESLSTRANDHAQQFDHLTSLLEEEKAANSALKKQLLHNMDQTRSVSPWGTAADLAPVVDMVVDLIEIQENPTGERYALVKVLQTNLDQLRSTFLFYSQLETSFTDQWPPRLTLDGWEEFYRDGGISDPRAGARISSSAQGRMVSVKDMKDIFQRYSHHDATKARLSYEGFLAALVDCATRLNVENTPFLSETVRYFIGKYVGKAKRIRAAGITKTRVKVTSGKKALVKKKSMRK